MATKPPKTEQARGFPMQTREAAVAPSTLNEDARTVELVWTTGATVRRTDWYGDPYDEELVVSPDAIDLARLNGGAPLLDNHNRWRGLGAQIGVVERAWIDGSEGRAVVRFPAAEDDPDADKIFRKVKGGIIRNVSVGYRVTEMEITKRDGQPPLYRAVKWEPLELSLVTIPADAGAGTRSADGTPAQPLYPCNFIVKEERAMPPEDTTTPPKPQEQRSEAEIIAAAVKAERERSDGIAAVCRSLKLPDEFASKHIKGGTSLEEARALAIDEFARAAPPPPAPGGGQRFEVGQDHTDPAAIRSAMVDAIAARATANLAKGARVEMTDQARQYADLSVLEMGAELAKARGEDFPRRMTQARLYDKLAERGHSTSDFPQLLAASGNKVLLVGYNLAQPTYQFVMTRKIFRDFKGSSFLRTGDFPTLLEKGENGEFKEGTVAESAEKVTLSTYGRILKLDRNILINDDMGAFADMPMKAGRRVASFENGLAWGVVKKNPKLSDGKGVFHSDHGNIGTGAAIGLTPIGSGRAAMMQQKSLDGDPLNILPKFLIAGPAGYTPAEQFCSQNVNAAKAEDVNVFAGQLTPVGDANIVDPMWYLVADPGLYETFVYGYLEGQEGPRFAMREGFATDGVEFRVALDFAVGAVDYKGWHRNAGV